MSNTRLLELRNKAKKAKPRFVIKESLQKGGRIVKRWRFPRGRHSPVRQQHHGKPVLVSIGFGSPRAVRGLHSSGLEKVLVHNTRELLIVDPQYQGAVIASGVGNKKRLSLLTLAQQKKIRILNVKDVAKAMQGIQHDFEERKKIQQQQLKDKSRKEAEKQKKFQEKGHKEGRKSGESPAVDEMVKTEEEKQKELMEKTMIKRQ